MKINWNKEKRLDQKVLAIGISLVIILSSVAIIELPCSTTAISSSPSNNQDPLFQTRPCNVRSVLTESGIWMSFDSTPIGTQPEATVTISDTTGITVVFDFHGFWRKEFYDNDTLYDEIVIPGTGSITDAGKPKLPRFIEYLEIPYNIEASVDILSTSSQTLSDYYIRPATSPVAPVWNLTLDDTEILGPIELDPLYEVDSQFPGNLYSLEGELNETSLIMRGRRLLEVGVYPAQYNPFTSNLTVYSQLIVKIKYSSPAQIGPVVDSLHSHTFERIFEGLIVNYYEFQPSIEQIAEMQLHQPVLFSPWHRSAEYLIIVTEPFVEQANRLADWKRRKGLLTEVQSFDVGVSSETIEGFLQIAYATWDPVPTYVVLFGDCEFIPTNYDMIHGGSAFGERLYDSETGFIASDLPYFTIDGGDFFPDFIHSRISVDTEDQARSFVDKLLRYENVPTIDPEFYSDILAAAYFEDAVPTSTGWSYDGKEEEEYPYVYYAEMIRHHLELLNYDVHVNYSADIHSTIQAPLEFYNGDPLCDHLLDPDFEWQKSWSSYLEEAADRIAANLNEGRFLVYHLDHGGSKNMVYPFDYNGDTEINNLDRDAREGWYQPSFNVTDLHKLFHFNDTPFVISISCNSGWFDGETDQDVMEGLFGNYENECFAEELTRRTSGAIAMIAASRASYNVAGGDMLNGIIQSFWPGILTYENQPIYEIGAALLLGKMHVGKLWKYNDNLVEQITKTTYEIFHLFGDPEMRLWTRKPSNFDVTYPREIGTSGTQQFAVTVRDNSEPVPYAKVCIQKSEDEYQVGYTNSLGQVVFSVKLENPGLMDLTITHSHYKPFLREINCIDSDAILDVDPIQGLYEDPVNFEIRNFKPTEDVTISFDGIRITTIPAGSLDAEDYVLRDYRGYVNVIAKGDDSGYVAIELFRCRSTLEGPDPGIFMQLPTIYETGYWDNPDIFVFQGRFPFPFMRARVVQSVRYTVNVIVHNYGYKIADNTKVSLFYAPFGGGTSWTPAGEDIITIEKGQTELASIGWTPTMTSDVSLKIKIDHPEDENELNNEGYESVEVISCASPGEQEFLVGNTEEAECYVSIRVQQLNETSDIWNASISDYSSQRIIGKSNESVKITIDPGRELESDEWRLFAADLYINGVLIGGMILNISNAPPPPLPLRHQDIILIIIVAAIGTIVVIALIIYIRRK